MQSGKGFDFSVIDILTENFFFKTPRMLTWFGMSRQTLNYVLEKRSKRRRDKWTGKELETDEYNIIHELAANRKFEYTDSHVSCLCLNNQRDDFACIFAYEDKIKCFFLKDLPEELQNEIIAADLHRFSEKDFAIRDEGKIVYILTKPCFIPANTMTFMRYAQRRNMTPDEYSIFISGFPLGKRNVTRDETIIAFFEKNLINGKVYISSSPKNQWIRGFASRNGYTLKEFIELYGYEQCTDYYSRENYAEEIKHFVVKDNVVYLPANSRLYRLLQKSTDTTVDEYLAQLGYKRTAELPKLDIEQDMDVRSAGNAGISDIFARFPLLGSKMFSDEELASLNESSRSCVERVIKNPASHLTQEEKMQVSLSLINFAKTWDSDEFANFWSFIALQFGYRDSNGAVIRILQSSLEDALWMNHRWFVEGTVKRAFKTTVMIHALSPKKAWMTLLDFLFDFYKENLQWKVVPDDPLIGLMVKTIKLKLMGADSEDTDLRISYKVYSLQEGICKLILLRPMFARSLFERLLLRIDSLVNDEHRPVETYEDQLCDDWYKHKISKITNAEHSERNVRNTQRAIATDYTRIRAKYVLVQETDIRIVLPDIRLQSENFQKATLIVSSNDDVSYQQAMSWYGNELGRSLNGVAVSLSSLPKEVDRTCIQVRVLCDEEEIYDSDDSLYRKVWAFRGGNECSINQLKRGNYTFVLPYETALSTENADVTEVDGFQVPGLQAFFLELKEGYSISQGDHLIAFENVKRRDIEITAPSESTALPKIDLDGEECFFAYQGSACGIRFGSADFMKKFLILRNGTQIDLSALPSADDNLTYTIPLSGEQNISQLQVINLADDRLLFDCTYLLVQHASCRFNRDFYYSPEDYSNARLKVEIDDYSESIPFGMDDDDVRIPYRTGEIQIAIPRVTIQESSGAWLDGSKREWYIGDIPQTSILNISAPSDVKVRFLIGGKDILYDGRGSVLIGNALHSVGSKDGNAFVDLQMLVDSKDQSSTYLLAKVCFAERFLDSPEFWEEDHKLFWDHGTAFIGKPGRTFDLSLFGEFETLYQFKLDENKACIDLPETMPVGFYRWEISMSSGNLFKRVKTVLARGDCAIGDRNQIRFKDRFIVINTITDNGNEKSGYIHIRRCYIDQITFQGMETTSEGYCPVYSGVMYKMLDGKRRDFASVQRKDKNGRILAAVNPVRIIYISDSVLSITDQDGDGLCYAHFRNAQTNETYYALTDRAYVDEDRPAFSFVDLYFYRVKKVRPDFTESKTP